MTPPFDSGGVGHGFLEITDLVEDGPAAKAGLKVGDKITMIDDGEIAMINKLLEGLSKAVDRIVNSNCSDSMPYLGVRAALIGAYGSDVSVMVLRDGKQHRFNISRNFNLLPLQFSGSL